MTETTRSDKRNKSIDEPNKEDNSNNCCCNVYPWLRRSKCTGNVENQRDDQHEHKDCNQKSDHGTPHISVNDVFILCDVSD